MKITFITGHLCKERHALLNELALDLGEYGAEVTVITGFPSRRIAEEVKDYYLAHPVEQISPNVIVRRVGSRKGEGSGLFDRMIKYAKLTWTIYKEAKKTFVTEDAKADAPVEYIITDVFTDDDYEAGDAPSAPVLQYLQNDPALRNLIDIRLTGEQGLDTESSSIECKSLDGMTFEEAEKLDAVLRALKLKGNASVTSAAEALERAVLEYTIEF